MNERIILILPYFGKFNNYFQLFIDSVNKNRDVLDLLIITDNSFDNSNFSNIFVKKTSFRDFVSEVKEKLGDSIILDRPYKLCDFKPAYGYIFEDYISGYTYWGHCDCDLIFGKVKNLLEKILAVGYDKIFAAGHLTLYKNTFENNRFFMTGFNGRKPYIEAFCNREIYVFDEDYRKVDSINVQDIYLQDDSKKMFLNDLSANISTKFNHLIVEKYDAVRRQFVIDDYTKKHFFYNNGEVFSLYFKFGEFVREDYLYIHLQMRKMRLSKKSTCYEICSDRFRPIKSKSIYNISRSKVRVRMRPIDYFIFRLKRKIKKIIKG